jgi:hypothetical protein
VSHVLDTVPMYAVMIDNVGQRGAHRVAYLDYYEITALKNAKTSKAVADSNLCSDSRFSSTPPASASTNSPSSSMLGLAAIVSLTFYAFARYR